MARLKQLWVDIKTSFWFLPTLIIMLLIAAAVAIIEVDQMLAAAKHTLPITLVSFQQESIHTFLYPQITLSLPFQDLPLPLSVWGSSSITSTTPRSPSMPQKS